jgi:acetoin utilization deacetylase AcuC-like enzyme
MTILVVHHESCFDHDTGSHPERTERLRVIFEAIAQAKNLPVERAAARPATREDILRCHTERHYDRVTGIDGQEGFLDADTVFSPGTARAALHAAGSGLAAIDLLAKSGGSAAFAAVRPPGHHATPNRAMGFCLFNNIAICARYAQARHGIDRVLIVDWDVHHGNGTQEIFYQDPTVFYYSLHLYPHYPGTGTAEETGAGPAIGTKRNRPLPHGYPAGHYVDTFRTDVADIFASFDPDLILISAGFDSHRDDPLGGLTLLEADFRALAGTLREHAGAKPIISFLEGGYNLACLGPSVVAHLEGIAPK